MTSAGWATRKSTVFCCPALSILGISTPEEFYGALQGESVGNGFLNRRCGSEWPKLRP
jgi:hypothetical protein